MCLQKKDLTRKIAEHHSVERKTTLHCYFSKRPQTALQVSTRPSSVSGVAKTSSGSPQAWNSLAPGGNHTGQEGFTSSMQEQCSLNTFNLRKKCNVSGVATKSRVHSAHVKKHRIHVSKQTLQTQVAAKETAQEFSSASADAPKSLCASDYDKTSGRQNRTLPCSQGSGFANSCSSDCAETSVGRAPFFSGDARSGSGFVLSALSASGKDTPVGHIPLHNQDLRRECQRVGIPTTIVQHSADGRKRHVPLRKEELTRELAVKVLCAPGCQDTQVDHSWNMQELRKECQRVGISLTHLDHTRHGRKRYVCLRKKVLVRQLSEHYVLKEKLHCSVISPKCQGQRNWCGGHQR